MAPYRSERDRQRKVQAPEAGPVADMVRQFADPHAFFRELIQNGIDAGASAIGVRIELADGACTTEVKDDGCGMSRAVIEGPLITLFSSSKEGDTSKIGKYGVGFVSVFAIDPERVEVETWQEGQAWLVTFYRDHSYDLAEAEPRSGSGTRVALVRPMDADAFEEHVTRSTGALRRWCRHSSCPIELVVVDHDRGKPAEITRIHWPFTVRAPVSVKAVVDGDAFVVGPSAGSAYLDHPADAASELEYGERFAGFYNRGLTLYETEEVFPGLQKLRFKVMSASLKHTLSRDNVRRDDAFERALRRVRDLAGEPLREQLRKELREAAEDAAQGHSMKRYVALLEAASLDPLDLPPQQIVLPLAHETAGSRTILLSDYRRHKPPLATQSPGALTHALAQLGEPVLLMSGPFVDSFLAGCLTPLPVMMAHQAFLLIDELRGDALRPSDRALCDAVRAALEEAGVGLTRIGMGKVVEGSVGTGPGDARTVALSVPDGKSGKPKLCKTTDAHGAWRTGSTLLLDSDHAVVEAARKRAESDPKMAGHLLARILLVEHGEMGAKQNDRLLALAVRDFT